MTDIVYKLRNPAWLWSQDGGSQLDKEETLIDLADAADEIERLRAAQPQPFTGCQLRGPGECQSRGMCLSDACEHTGKTIRPRYMAEPREDGIKYPSFAERTGP